MSGEPRILEERYRLERILGQGGMARTWLAVDLSLERELMDAPIPFEDRDHDGIPDAARVAIKELPLHRLREWKDLTMFEREAKMLGTLDHPGIPNSLEHFVLQEEGGPTFYLVQEWVDGESLQDQLDRGQAFSEARVRELLWQLLPILQYLHTRKPSLVHRDIKPSNIMVRRKTGELALIDFGAVREAKAGDSGPVSTVVGTFGFMAPEQLRGKATPTSDIYALGATCCALLCRRDPGEMPVKGRPFLVDFRSFCFVSDPFAKLLDAMLRPEPEDRLRDAQATLRMLDGLDLTPPPDGHAAPEPAPALAESPSGGQTALARPRDLGGTELTYAFFDLPSRWRYAGLLLSVPLLVPPLTPLGIMAMICAVFFARKNLREGRRNRELLRRGTYFQGTVEKISRAGGEWRLDYTYTVHRQTYRASLEIRPGLRHALAPGDSLQIAVDPYQPEDSVPLLGRLRT